MDVCGRQIRCRFDLKQRCSGETLKDLVNQLSISAESTYYDDICTMHPTAQMSTGVDHGCPRRSSGLRNNGGVNTVVSGVIFSTGTAAIVQQPSIQLQGWP